ncbi:hypothetical protein [Pseudonocardia sp. T1-2H]|uniref:hypothetical protein n=1 Tax=Pseudonocardia sp. T1-2H TaxID=3128899 RepID=UPI0031016E97
MKCGVRVALGVAGGYFLGRTKKMKLAMMLGGMAAGRRAGGPGELLAQGSKLLERSPELAALTDQIRGRLIDAGKGAAMAVAARQVESLTDRVGKRVESLGDLGGPKRRPAEAPDVADETDDVADETGEEPDAQERGAAAEDVEADEPPAEAPAPPRRRRTARAAGNAGGAGGAGGKATAGRAAAAGTKAARGAASKAKAGRRTSNA